MVTMMSGTRLGEKKIILVAILLHSFEFGSSVITTPESPSVESSEVLRGSGGNDASLVTLSGATSKHVDHVFTNPSPLLAQYPLQFRHFSRK